MEGGIQQQRERSDTWHSSACRRGDGILAPVLAPPEATWNVKDCLWLPLRWRLLLRQPQPRRCAAALADATIVVAVSAMQCALKRAAPILGGITQGAENESKRSRSRRSLTAQCHQVPPPPTFAQPPPGYPQARRPRCARQRDYNKVECTGGV